MPKICGNINEPRTTIVVHIHCVHRLPLDLIHLEQNEMRRQHKKPFTTNNKGVAFCLGVILHTSVAMRGLITARKARPASSAGGSQSTCDRSSVIIKTTTRREREQTTQRKRQQCDLAFKSPTTKCCYISTGLAVYQLVNPDPINAIRTDLNRVVDTLILLLDAIFQIAYMHGIHEYICIFFIFEANIFRG